MFSFFTQMGAKGAEALTKLYTSTSHTTQLCTLNVSKNNIGRCFKRIMFIHELLKGSLEDNT